MRLKSNIILNILFAFVFLYSQSDYDEFLIQDQKKFLIYEASITAEYEEYEIDEETDKSKYIDQMCTENMFEDNTFDNL